MLISKLIMPMKIYKASNRINTRPPGVVFYWAYGIKKKNVFTFL